MDSAAQDVQAAINAAAGTLPTNLPYPPVYSKVNPADAPILTLALTSDSLPIDAGQRCRRHAVATETLRRSTASARSPWRAACARRSACGSIRRGSPPTGLSMEDVRTAVATANANGAKGGFDGPRLAVSLGANDQLVNAERYQNLVIAWRNGAPVRLSAVGQVISGVENDRVGAWYFANGKPSRPRCSTSSASPAPTSCRPWNASRRRCRRCNTRSRRGSQLGIVTDRTETIRASVRDVQLTLIMSVVLVVLVIFAVPALPARHVHPGHRPAAVADRHLRGHGAAGLRPRQSVADGADRRHRLRGRRRDRDDRERRPLHRAGRAPAGGRVSRRRRRSASPSCR